jgi:type IV pilus assembly protein PilE
VKKQRGFTLIEIMVTVAIIGILVAIALPSYQNYLRKGRRADAEAYLSDLANRQQQYLLDARAYALGGTAFTDLNAPVPTTVANFYTVTMLPAAATVPPTFTVTAVPTGQQAVPAPDDGTLSIDEKGTKKRMVGGTDKGW